MVKKNAASSKNSNLKKLLLRDNILFFFSDRIQTKQSIWNTVGENGKNFENSQIQQEAQIRSGIELLGLAILSKQSCLTCPSQRRLITLHEQSASFP